MKSPTPTASGNPALPSSIDPCSLLTAEQASALNGITYKGGGTQPPANGLSMCSWDNAKSRAMVEVGFAFWPSAADAQAAYDAALASAATAGSAITPVADLADGAVIARQTPAPAVTGADGFTGAGGIFVRRGALVITVAYYSGTTPTDAALEAAATHVLGELPQLAR